MLFFGIRQLQSLPLALVAQVGKWLQRLKNLSDDKEASLPKATYARHRLFDNQCSECPIACYCAVAFHVCRMCEAMLTGATGSGKSYLNNATCFFSQAVGLHRAVVSPVASA